MLSFFLADIDEDNDLLSTSEENDKISIYKNLGNGIFELPQIISYNPDSSQ